MIVIPTCSPDDELIKLINKLIKLKIKPSNILIVDDHSPEYDSIKIFKKIISLGCHVIKNKNNKGKGSAIKFALSKYDIYNFDYILTADSDGQHSANDIIKINKYGLEKSEFILGQRSFGLSVPVRNRFSNKISSLLFKLLTKKKLTDTQCGLRFIPKKYFDKILKIKEYKFDFELKMLFVVLQNGKIEKKEIETIYSKENYKTNFRKLYDTFLIIRVFVNSIF